MNKVIKKLYRNIFKYYAKVTECTIKDNVVTITLNVPEMMGEQPHQTIIELHPDSDRNTCNSYLLGDFG